MLLNNVVSFSVIIINLEGYVKAWANERKRVFKFTKISTTHNVITTANPSISTENSSAISRAAMLMQFGPFKCMEYDHLQNRFKSNNGGQTVDSLVSKMEPGWSFYYAKSPRKSYEECKLNDLGREYRGKKNTSVTGIPCMVWSAPWPNPASPAYPNCQLHLTTEEGPDIWNTNYCRNPDYTGGGPWCYTMDPNKRWETCGVPFCTCYI